MFKVKYKIIFLIIIFFPLFKQNAKAQLIKEASTNIYFTPLFTVGYTLNSGFNYGVDLTIGLFTIQNNIPQTNAGISFQYYIVNYDESQHRIFAINIIAENDYFRIGGGMAQISKKWGFKNRNKNRAIGTSLDFGISTYHYKTPWLAFKTFVPLQQWELCLNPYYISTYSYFKFEPIKIL